MHPLHNDNMVCLSLRKIALQFVYTVPLIHAKKMHLLANVPSSPKSIYTENWCFLNINLNENAYSSL